jgi:hypothetical protein
MDELTMFASLRPDSEVLPADERAALRVSLFGSSADPALDALPSIADDPESTLTNLEPRRSQSGPRRRSRRVTHVVLAIAVAAAVVTTMIVISRDHTTAPADTPIPVPSPLDEPSPDEVAAASNAGVYVPGSATTEVTATRSYVSLRRCAISGYPVQPCDGPEGWAYVTGSVDGLEAHYGLLGPADDLVVSAIDDGLFVASSASLSQDPPSAPSAWLIDSVTGHRGPLTWVDEPTTLDSAEQVVVLFPSPNPTPFDVDSGERFLPRVVDRRDWTIGPLSVPDDATAVLAIHQSGSGRIWIGIAPDGGEVGLAYTDDGGASWTGVEIPEFLRPTSEELASGEGGLVVAASGDHVAVDEATADVARPVYVSADAGETWNTVLLDPAKGNGRTLFVLADNRLMLVDALDFEAVSMFVSSTPSDWSQLEEEFPPMAGTYSTVGAFQHGLVVNYSWSEDVAPPLEFSTDLTDWWTIPGLDFCAIGQC